MTVSSDPQARKNQVPKNQVRSIGQVLAALKGDKTVNEVAARFGVHPTLIHDWKKKLLGGAAAVVKGVLGLF